MDKNRKKKEKDKSLDELIEKLKGSPGRKFDEHHMILPFIMEHIDEELEEIKKKIKKRKRENEID